MLFECPQCIVDYLQQEHEVYDGCIGRRFDLSQLKRDGHFLLPKVDFPVNIQEYDVFIVDLKKPNIEPYAVRDHERRFVSDGENMYFWVPYSQTILDSTPFGAHLFRYLLPHSVKQPQIIIIFQKEQYECSYTIVDRLSDYDYRNNRDKKFSNYEFASSLHLHNSEIGEQFFIENNAWAKKLFLGMEDRMTYKHFFLGKFLINRQMSMNMIRMLSLCCETAMLELSLSPKVLMMSLCFSFFLRQMMIPNLK